jgi:hypothetical protein
MATSALGASLVVLMLLVALSTAFKPVFAEQFTEEDAAGIASLEAKVAQQQTSADALLKDMDSKTKTSLDAFKKDVDLAVADTKAESEKQGASISAEAAARKAEDDKLTERIAGLEKVGKDATAAFGTQLQALDGQFKTMGESVKAHDSRLPPNGVSFGSMLLKASDAGLQVCRGTSCKTVALVDAPVEVSPTV